jgi:hypothetical protein
LLEKVSVVATAPASATTMATVSVPRTARQSSDPESLAAMLGWASVRVSGQASANTTGRVWATAWATATAAMRATVSAMASVQASAPAWAMATGPVSATELGSSKEVLYADSLWGIESWGATMGLEWAGLWGRV